MTSSAISTSLILDSELLAAISWVFRLEISRSSWFWLEPRFGKQRKAVHSFADYLLVYFSYMEKPPAHNPDKGRWATGSHYQLNPVKIFGTPADVFHQKVQSFRIILVLEF